MLRKLLFIFFHNLYDSRFYKTYKMLQQSQWKDYDDLKKEQEVQLRKILEYSYNNVPYYHDLFRLLKLHPRDIKKFEDLEKLPILTKEIVKRNWSSFIPANLDKMKYINRATGGSTGTPLKYRITKFERVLHWATIYNTWGCGGYELGDKVLIFGGGSLVPDKNAKWAKFIYKLLRNFIYLSSFDMDEKDMKKYVNIINRFKPKIGYGYPSSWDLLAKFIKLHNLKIFSPSAIFTTSEKLYPPIREEIEEVFRCKVMDAYGLNDGGISAYECSKHSGLHINTERSILEVVDKKGNQLKNGKGRILATSLYNYVMPFIRYETGDIGYIIDDMCTCGRGHKLLKDLIGRSVDVFITPEGKNVHGWFFLFIFWKHCKGIKEYQVIQETLDKIVIEIVKDEKFEEIQLDEISKIVREKSEGWNIEYKFVDKIERTGAGKYKFIINKIR